MIKVSYISPYHNDQTDAFFQNAAEANLYIKWLMLEHTITHSSDASISEVPGDASDYVWVVNGDDRNYDEGSVWLVGVFTTFEKAYDAAEQEKIRYSGTDALSVDICQMQLDEY